MSDREHVCPDALTLAALFDGLLDPEARDALHARMADCADCRETLALLGAELAAAPPLAELPPAPAGLADRIRARVLPRAAPAPRPLAIAARWLDGALTALADALAPLPAPALATRGPTPDPGLRYEVDLGGAPVELLLSGDPSAPGAHLTARALGPLPPRARLVLLRDGRIQASLAFEPDGVVLPALPPGRYELRLEGPGATPTVLPLRLEG